jgi:hypothetical protein
MPLQRQMRGLPHEIRIPRMFEGMLQYVMMEMVVMGDSVEDWVMRQRTVDPSTMVPAGTNVLPGYSN